MSRDEQRWRKNYSYYRPLPREGTITFAVDESLDWKNSVRAASSEDTALSGAGTSLSFGGITIVDEDRVLLKGQSTSSQNGIYYFEVSGGNYTLTRASDARQGTLSSGATTYVEEGTSGGKIYILSTTGTITVDSTPLTWTELSGGGGGTPAGSNTQVQFNDGGIFGASSNFTFNKSTNLLKALNISGSLTSSNVSTGQVLFARTGGVLSGTNNLFWDNTNRRLGIGTSSPIYSLEIRSGTPAIKLIDTDSNSSFIQFFSGSTQTGGVNSSKINTSIFSGDGSGNNGYLVLNANQTLLKGTTVQINGSSTIGVTGSMIPSQSSTYDLGSADNNWKNLFAITGHFVSYAEINNGDAQYTYLDIRNASGSLSLGIDDVDGFYTGVPYSPVCTYSSSFFMLDSNTGAKSFSIDSTGKVWLPDNQYFTWGDVVPGTSPVAQIRGSSTPSDNLQFYVGSSEAMRITSAGNVGIGTTLANERLVVNGNSVFSGSLDVFGDMVEVTGTLKVTNGISGSLTRLTDGTPYLIAGTNVVLSTGSNGSITITAAGGGGGSTLPGGSVKDVQFNKDGVSFGGNTSFTFDESTSTMTVTNMSGSLTRLANGTSYLIAGNNVTITSASSGAVTIAAATGIGGSGTVNYVPKFATSTTLNNSILSQPYNNTMEIAPGGSPYSTELSLKNAVDPGKDGVLGLASSISSGLSANAISGDVVLKAKLYTNSVILAIGTSEALRASYNSYTRVGIGTSSPDTTKFHVYSDVADVGFFDGTLGTGGTLSFRNRSVGNTTTLKLGYGTNTSAAASGNNAAIDYNASQNLIISRGGTEVARFDSSSQVGIGTTSTGAKLHVSSANDEVVRVQGTSSANPQVTLYRDSTLNGYLNAYSSGGDNYVSLFANSSNYLKLYSYSERIEMWPAGNLALTVETNGNVTLEKSSAVVDATTYPNQGIKLNAVPGNAGAQVLDAYYETEYTVTLESTVATGLFTLYSSPFNILKFTRVGRMMTLCGTLWVSNVQTTAYGKQRLYIDVPLPNAAYYPSVASAASVWVDDFSNTGAFSPQGFIYTTGSSTRIYIDGVANLNQVDIADYVAVGSIITVSVTYVGASS